MLAHFTFSPHLFEIWGTQNSEEATKRLRRCRVGSADLVLEWRIV
jgi:hypothetical protein